MTKKALLKSSLVPISFILLVTAILLACADVEISPYPDSFFAPEISHSDRDAHFFVSDNTLYKIGYKTDYIDDFDSINVQEWFGYFKYTVSAIDLSYLLYKSRLTEIDSLIFYLKKPGMKLSSKLRNNSIIKFTDTRSTIDFLYYIGYAKRCAAYSTYNPGDWYDDEKTKANDPRNDKAGMLKLAQGGIKQIGNAGTNFVKQRYAFQVVRLYYQMKQFDSCINFYNTNAAVLNSVENTIRYRAMSYVAGAYNEKNEIAEANFTYSIVFDKCEPMRDAAYFSFKPQEEKDFAQSLALCTSTRQKEMLWQMLGIYGDPLRAMKEIYKLNPKSDALDLLLMRAVNKEEEKFLDQDWVVDQNASGDSLSYIKTSAINKELVSFTEQVATAGNTWKPYEWSLAAGYLDWAIGGKDFEKYLAGVNDEVENDPLAGEELRMIRMLDKIRNGKAGDKNFEASILPDLKWLKDTNHDADFRRGFAWIYVNDALAQKYAAIKNTALATCFTPDLINRFLEIGFSKPDKPISDSLITTLENFFDKKNKSAFEQFAMAQLPFTEAGLYKMQAIYALYNYDVNGALEKLKLNVSAGNDSLYGDPFLIHIMDNHDSDAVLPNKSVHTKIQFVEKMVELQKKADHGSKDAQDYFMLANGYYNMSYFGNNRVLFESTISRMYIYEFDDTYSENRNTPPAYMSCAKALQYYQQAMNLSTNAEFKAKCCFMCAKCEQNDFFCHKAKDYKGDFKTGTYFAMLKSDYSKTQYYQEVIKECGYFDTYAHITRPR